MADDLTFMMGEFEARFPTDRQYVKNHMWASKVSSGAFRFGFGAYAVRLLQDVYFLEWEVDAGAQLATGQKIGFIESSKAESDLFTPDAGELTTINEELLNDPSAINTDKYEQGWLFELTCRGEDFMSPSQYIEHLTSVWEVTQRTIKGQMN